MRDLEQNIIAWREEMRRAGITRPEFLDELETHLCAEIEKLKDEADEEAAFRIAVSRLGDVKKLKQEFAKLEQERFWPWWNAATSLKVLGVWFVLAGLSGLSFLPPLLMVGDPTVFPVATCLGFCALQMMIGAGLMLRVNFWRWCAVAWAGLFLLVGLGTLNPVGGITQHFIFFHFHFPDDFVTRVGGLSRWQLVFSTRFADFRHVTDFLSPAILIWGIWLLMRRQVRELFERENNRRIA